MWFLALLSVFAAFVLAGLSVFPGVLDQVPPESARFLAGAAGVFAAGTAGWHLVGPARPGKPRQRRSAVVILVALVLAATLLLTAAPRALVFRLHRHQFEELLERAPPPGDRAATPLNADLSIYWIDQWGTDARGGTYFRTASGRADGRADRRSFGFAYRPNPDGSPFGNRGYELRPLTGDWYSFSATDDR